MDRIQFIFRNVVPWVVLIHAVLFIVYWLSNGLFTTDTNAYLGRLLGGGRDYIAICLWIAGAVGAWSLARFAAARLGWSHALVVPAAWLYAAVSLLFIAFFYGSFVILFRESPVQAVRLGQLVQYFRAALDPLLLLGAAAVTGWSLRTLKPGNLWPLAGGALLLALLWLLPLSFYPVRWCAASCLKNR